LRIYIVTEDFKSKELLFTEKKQQYGKRAMQQKVCFIENVRSFFGVLNLRVLFRTMVSVEFKLGQLGLSEL